MAPIHEAAQRGDLPGVMAILLQQQNGGGQQNLEAPWDDIEPSFLHYNATALGVAARFKHLHLCEWLISAGALVNAQSFPHHFTPFYFACWEGHAQIILLLLAKGAILSFADTSELQQAPLHILARFDRPDNVSLIQTFIKRGVEMDVQDGFGMTPLMLASYW